MLRASTRAFFSLWLAGFVVFGCGDSTQPDAVLGSLAVDFDHVVSGVPVALHTISYTNAAGNSYSIVTLRYYVSNIVLHRTDGSTYAPDVLHYRDIEDPATRRLELENVPDGSYDRLTFTFGLDAVKNVSGSLPTTQENLNMAWPEPWGGGYHYMLLEGHFVDDTGDTTGYATHTGRRKLDTDPAPHHHFFEVTVLLQPAGSSSIQIQDDAWQVEIEMDLDEWYTDPNTYDLNDFRGNIMTNLDAQRLLMENGSTVFSAREASLVQP